MHYSNVSIIEDLNFFNCIIFKFLEKICTSYNHLNIEKNTSNLKHTHKPEIIFVISGQGGIVIDDKSSIIKTGDVIRISQNKIRSITNLSASSLKIISINLEKF